MTNATQTALSRNAGYIRELTLKYTSIYNIFAPPVDESGSTHTVATVGIHQCTNLRRLDLLLYDDPKRRPNGHWDWDQPQFFDNPLDSALDEAVALLIRRNPGLTVLVIEKPTCFKTLLPLLVHDVPNLEELHCSTNCSIDEHLAKVLLEHLPEHIRSVRICMYNPDIAGLDSIADAVRAQLKIQEPRQHHALELLHIAGTFHTAKEYLFLLPFLDTCRKPLTVHILGNKWFEEPQIKEAFSRLGIFLRNLHPTDLQNGSASSDAEIAKYIRLSAHWETIHLQDCRSAGSLTVAAVLNSCDHLESLNLSGCNLVSSAEIQLILEKAARLKVYEALKFNNSSDSDDPFIFATDFIALEWGSRSLKKFNCRIAVPRPTFDTGEEEKGPSKSLVDITASRAIQRQVYQKLAEQKSLEVLHLGHHPSLNAHLSERRFQTQCLEMTLGSGLDELSSLKELGTLNVSTMAQRIGVPELEWMNKNWPKLQKLRGMFANCTDPVPGAREWIRDMKPDWVYHTDLLWFAHLHQ
ncbi:hypothetical protein BGZ93_001786 [Podila epicladia]|nr:hypothetical protein BGZ93_001786 [Podila epicladia]